MMAILHEDTPVVEKMSIGEAYLDLTERVEGWEEAVALVSLLQERVLEDVGLSASLGWGTNNLVSKVASDHDKPGGLTLVPPDGLAGLAVTSTEDLRSCPRQFSYSVLGSTWPG